MPKDEETKLALGGFVGIAVNPALFHYISERLAAGRRVTGIRVKAADAH